MESEPGAPASTANNTGATTTSSSTTTSSNTTATSSSSISSTTTTTIAPTTSASGGNSSSGSSGTSNTSITSSSSTTTGRQAVPQISVYSGIPDRQTVQVSSCIACDIHTNHIRMQMLRRKHTFGLLPSVGVIKAAYRLLMCS